MTRQPDARVSRSTKRRHGRDVPTTPVKGNTTERHKPLHRLVVWMFGPLVEEAYARGYADGQVDGVRRAREVVIEEFDTFSADGRFLGRVRRERDA